MSVNGAPRNGTLVFVRLGIGTGYATFCAWSALP